VIIRTHQYNIRCIRTHLSAHIAHLLLLLFFVSSYLFQLLFWLQISVATVHLESLTPNANMRKLQLTRCFRLLQPPNASPTVFFMGDFNFGVKYDENKHLKATYKQYLDTWEHVHPAAPGVCCFCPSNTLYICLCPFIRVVCMYYVCECAVVGYTMPIKKDAKFPPWRPDRIMLRSAQLTAKSIEIQGTKQIPYDKDTLTIAKLKYYSSQLTLTPSDHYMLCAHYVLRAQTQTKTTKQQATKVPQK